MALPEYFSDSITLDRCTIFVNLKHTHIPADFTFIGLNGNVLKKCSGVCASYTCIGDEGYVRVEVKREDGTMAWIQPFWIE